ncbi:MAG: glycosyltransferase involved in cell wall biosynthesis [Phenylobacterium sp.]|jgi:glycosyltransferase involved in cell wall biosynthesis
MSMSQVTIQVVQHLSPGGIETMALDLQQFSQNPGDSFIVSLQGNKDTFIERWPRLADRADRLIFLDKPPGLSWQTICQLQEIFERLKADVVHTHHIGPLLYGGIAAKMAKVKNIIHTEHDAWHLQPLKRRFIERALLHFVDPILVADAHVVAQELINKLNVAPPKIIQNGIDTQRFIPGDKKQARSHFSIPQDAIVIGCAARLIAVKGHTTLLAAMKNLPEQVHLVLAGHGEEEASLRALVKADATENRIHFLGNVDDMPGFYQAIDIFCLPSFKEGFPLSPLEAQSTGVPVVASDTGGVKETLCPDTGALVAVGDPEHLARALQTMVTKLYTSGCLAENAWLDNSAHNYSHQPSAIETLQQGIRRFVTGNNDVRQMASHYHGLYVQTEE